MSHPDAFYLSDLTPPYVLTGGEAAHCGKVLRKRPGDIVRLFDGRGNEGLFTITPVARDRVELEAVSLSREPEAAQRVHLAAGFSRSARRDLFLEKSVELGAAGLFFWQAERTQGRMPEVVKDSWTTTLVAAAKQCGAARLPGLELIPGGAARLIAATSDRFDRRYLLWEAPNTPRRLAPTDLTAPGDVLCVLGPEGGLTEGEVDAFTAAGFEAVSLGRRVLRWETAGLAVLALALIGS
jgi:16S rRNA (uracil1498-N3)-methyltransferase